MDTSTITVQTTIAADLQKVWEHWTKPQHIVTWNFATEDWKCPHAENDIKVGGKFSWRMEAKDGSMGFDYAGTYHKVEEYVRIEKKLEDGRRVSISFSEKEGETTLIEEFEPEKENDLEMQRMGWQLILDNFKKNVEAH